MIFSLVFIFISSITATRKIIFADFFYRKICCVACRADTDFDLEVDLQGAYQHFSMTVDNAGIFVMTAMLALFWPHRQVCFPSPSPSSSRFSLIFFFQIFNLAYSTFKPQDDVGPWIIELLTLGLIQIAVNVISDIVSLCFEFVQGVPTMRIINEEPYRIFAWEFLSYLQIIALVLCASFYFSFTIIFSYVY